MPPRVKPTANDAHFAFAWAIQRVHTISHFLGEGRQGTIDPKQGAIDIAVSFTTLESTPEVRLSDLMVIRLALLEVARQSWIRFDFSDQRVNELLGNNPFCMELRAARNKVLHPALVSEWHEQKLSEDPEFGVWMQQLLEAMTAYTREWLARQMSPDFARRILEENRDRIFGM